MTTLQRMREAKYERRNLQRILKLLTAHHRRWPYLRNRDYRANLAKVVADIEIRILALDERIGTGGSIQ